MKSSDSKLGGDSIYTFARQRVEDVRRQKMTKMPAWLKQNRDAYRDRLVAVALECYEQTGIWFVARGASRDKDEQETLAVWGDLLYFGDLKSLPGYSKENQQQAVEFWQSWQNRKTGRLYNPFYQDPQNPEVKRNVPGNREDYCPDEINIKYIPNILEKLGAELPGPVNSATRANAGEDTFDLLWKSITEWSTSPAGAYPFQAARELEEGNLNKIPQIEAGMGALVRAYGKETGMWRPESLEGFPWKDYQPSSGFKIISRICGYVGMENFPEELLKIAVDNLLEHKNELYAHPSTARNYSETMAHHLMLSDYRYEEQLDAIEECLNGFRDQKAWENTGTGCYCVFGSGFIGAFINWKDLPFDQAISEWMRFEHGCKMKWRFVVGPYGNWVNVMAKEPEAIFGHPEYDVRKFGLKARNKVHWSKKIVDMIPQQKVSLRLNGEGNTGEGEFSFWLTKEQLAKLKEPYLKATWSGAYDISLNGEWVKQVQYNLPDVSAGWYLPSAVRTLHIGENTVCVKLTGPGKEQKTDAPLATQSPFIHLGLIDFSR